MVDSNDRERVQESADELQKMVSTQSPGEEKSLCQCESQKVPHGLRTYLSLWAQSLEVIILF